MNYTYHAVDIHPPEVTASTSWDIQASASPIWWIGKKTAVELEVGHWASYVEFESEGASRSISYNSWFVLPQLLFSPFKIDSALTTYMKAGIGILTIKEDYDPFGYSAGVGAFILPESQPIIKAEIIYKFRFGKTGTALIEYERAWHGLYFTIGIGLKI